MAWFFALLLLLASPPAPAQQAAPVPQAAPASDTEARALLRERILDAAQRYAEFEWQGGARNVLHGPDADGTHVDTSDASFDPAGWRVDGTPHRGMPYAWGGFTSVEEFRAGLAQGRPAGHVPTTERAQPSAYALGLDCSGYVARCWDLPVKQSTRSLGALCYPLAGYVELQPADILNRFDSHVVIFERWLDDARTRMSVYEAGLSGVVRSEYAVEKLKSQDFEPMRFRPLDERWLPMTHAAPAFSALPAEAGAPRGRWIADAAGEGDAGAGVSALSGDGAPPSAAALAEFSALPSPLRDARPGEWVRHAVVKGDDADAAALERLSMVGVAQGPHVEIQTETVLQDGTIPTGTQLEHADTFLDALLDFAASDEALRDMEVAASTVTRGRYELAGRSFPAVRVEADFRATRVMRHQDFPVTLTIDCVISDAVPVHGILQARVVEETVWRAEPPEERSVSRWVSNIRLLECGAGG